MALWGRRRLTQMGKDDNNTPIDDPEAEFGRAVDRALGEFRSEIGKYHRQHGINLHGKLGLFIFFRRNVNKPTGYDFEIKISEQLT